MRVSYGKFSVVLTGDAEGETTDAILEKFSKGEIASDILQMCHHGSETEGSNNVGWIQDVNPKYAIFSSGLRDRWFHPSIRIAERLVFLRKNDRLTRLTDQVKNHRLTCGKGSVRIIQDPCFKFLQNLAQNEFKVINRAIA